MELKAKINYYSAFGEIRANKTTIGREEFTEEIKQKMLVDFPEVFEVIEGEATPATPQEELAISTPEDGFVVETTEAKSSKIRKK